MKLEIVVNANDDSSILHLLIPRSKDGLGNEQCTMFVQSANPGARVDDQYRLWVEAGKPPR